MSGSLDQLEAEVFKALGHPARIRILELLSDAELSVAELQRAIGVEAPNLSQQLAVLRRAGMVTARRQGTSVFYSAASVELAEMLAVARLILAEVAADRIDMLQDLHVPAWGRRG